MATILIIDDAAFSRRMIRKALQIEGYEIMEAATGREGIDGFAFLRALHEQGLKSPAILISADIQESSRSLGF